MKQHFPSFRTLRTSRTAKTLTAAALALALTGGTVAAALAPQPANAAAVSRKTLTRQAEKVSGTGTASGAGTIKEETVYVKTDATGGRPSVTVSDRLKNVNGAGRLADRSDLTGITNLKGNEKFEQNGSALTWQTQNKDIYYQGRTDKPLPLSVRISYKLDGQSIAAEDIAGKSGRLEMTIFYNNTSTTDGIRTPFAAATALNLPAKKFTDVQIDHGTVVADGTNNVVVGLAFPGLTDNLGLAGQTEIQIPETVTITAEVKHFAMGPTITAASTDVLEKAGLDKVDSFADLDRAVNQLENASAQLVAGSLSAKNGAAKLTAGAGTLQKGLATYTGGVATAANGSADLTAGAKSLAGGLAALHQQTPALSQGVARLYGGSQQLVAGYQGDGTATNPGAVKGAAALKSGSAQVSGGVTRLKSQLNTLNAALQKSDLSSVQTLLAGYQANLKTEAASAKELGAIAQALYAKGDAENGAKVAAQAKTLGDKAASDGQALQQASKNLTALQNNMTALKKQIADAAKAGGSLDQLEGGAKSVASGAADLNDGIAKLAKGTAELNAGLKQLNGKTGSLSSGAAQLASGSQTLAKGSKTLSDGLSTLKANNANLNSGASRLNAGSATLSGGLGSLYSGMHQFKTTGIDKLAGYYRHDFKGVLNHLKTIRQAGKDYNNFSGKADAMGGSVHFVIETSEIK